MLLGLTIRDFVLIERLDLAFRPGLCVLTGETGDDQGPLAQSVDHLSGERCDDEQRRGPGQQPQPGAERSVALRDLEELRQEE